MPKFSLNRFYTHFVDKSAAVFGIRYSMAQVHVRIQMAYEIRLGNAYSYSDSAVICTLKIRLSTALDFKDTGVSERIVLLLTPEYC